MKPPPTISENDLVVSIRVPYATGGNTATQINAHGLSARTPLPYLRFAVAALQAEIEGFSRCPLHGAAGPEAYDVLQAAGYRLKLTQYTDGWYATWAKENIDAAAWQWSQAKTAIEAIERAALCVIESFNPATERNLL